MPAYRLSFDLNFENIFAQSPERDPQRQAEMLRDFAMERLLVKGRKLAQAQIRQAQQGEPTPAKEAEIVDHMQTLMLAIMAEANFRIEPLPADHVVETQLPFEKAYEVPADDA